VIDGTYRVTGKPGTRWAKTVFGFVVRRGRVTECAPYGRPALAKTGGREDAGRFIGYWEKNFAFSVEKIADAVQE
jgi:hypothetical protein